MTSKNRFIVGKNLIKGGEGSKMIKKNRTSFMHDPLLYGYIFIYTVTCMYHTLGGTLTIYYDKKPKHNKQP